MDFFKIIQSLEELLYEVMTWLVFYPRTMWRAVRHPIQLLHYSDRELKDVREDQFTDLLSPPLFLLLTILLSHLVELSLHQSLPRVTTEIGKQFVSSDQNLLILRAVLFSIYPILFAVMRLRHQKIPLNRDTLREPFFAQCYIAAPSAFALGIAAILMRASQPILILGGVILAIMSIAWYLRIETVWLRSRLRISKFRSFTSALGTWIFATALNSVASFLIVGA